jgi:hypothetical protein
MIYLFRHVSSCRTNILICTNQLLLKDCKKQLGHDSLFWKSLLVYLPCYKVLCGEVLKLTETCFFNCQVIEIPRGSKVKYELDKGTGLIKVS